MKQAILILMTLACLSAKAGPHTLQKGETFKDVAELYKISLESLKNVNKNNLECTGMTIDVPLNNLVYDIGESSMFRIIRLKPYSKKGWKLYESGRKKQNKVDNLYGQKRIEAEQEISDLYLKAAFLGNTSALRELGRRQIHGRYESYSYYPDFAQPLNNNLEEFRQGLEYLQIAAIVDKDKYALAELALAFGYEKSPIRNPYMCVSILEQNKSIFGKDVNDLICYMYENGYGIRKNLLQAYIYCPSTELIGSEKAPSHRERILAAIDTMEVNSENSKYGVGLKPDMLMSMAFTHYSDSIMDDEGLFFLHRAARMGNGEAYLILAEILQNGYHKKGSMGGKYEKEKQFVCLLTKAAECGNMEAKDYLEKYKKYREEKAEQERLLAEERRREKQRRRNENIARIGMALTQAATQTFVAIENAKQQEKAASYNSTNIGTGRLGSMSNAQFNQYIKQSMQTLAVQSEQQVNLRNQQEYLNSCRMPDGSMSMTFEEFMQRKADIYMAVKRAELKDDNGYTSGKTTGTTKAGGSSSDCSLCHGSGRIVHDSYPGTLGTADYKVKCNECGGYFLKSTGHSHISCPQCHGH